VSQNYTKGWLPYALKWSFEVKKIKKPFYLEIQAFGDLEGQGVWSISEIKQGCQVVYDWQIAANKPILKKLSWLLKPIFAANHHWAMQKGEESLKLEIRRQKGEYNVPKPPKPTFPHNLLDNNVL
jgi:hypothetical protein